MYTNTYCTIYRIDNISGTAILVRYYDVMWQETHAMQVKKYGAENADKATIYLPCINADVSDGDYIVRGKIAIKAAEIVPDDIINKSLKITSVTRHDYGSTDMQHLRLGVNPTSYKAGV